MHNKQMDKFRYLLAKSQYVLGKKTGLLAHLQKIKNITEAEVKPEPCYE